jgi:aminopeptidase N
MRNEQVVTVRRADYRAPRFLLDQVQLEFDLDPLTTHVTTTLAVRRNPQVAGPAGPLQIDGEDLDLVSVELTAARCRRRIRTARGRPDDPAPRAFQCQVRQSHRPARTRS